MSPVPAAHADCPFKGLVEALRDHRLSGAEAEVARAHAVGCGRCEALLLSPRTLAFPTAMPMQAGGGTQLSRGASIGRYLVLEQLGSGGMGVVYAAFDPELDRRVAIKLLQSTSPDGQAWLLREAQAMAKLSHPNVVSVFDVGTFVERVFVAMELVEGETLRQWLLEPHSVNEVLDVFVAAGRGLHAAHLAGVVHRDFKPDNVILGKEGRVRVMDFGLARAPQQAATPPLRTANPSPSPVTVASDLTRADVVVGTPRYMAPELHGRAPATALSDQFSFAVSLYEALFGQAPFEGQPEERDPSVRWQIRPPPKAAAGSARVRRVVFKALSEDPAQRYGSIAGLLEDLRPQTGPARMPFLWAGGVLAAAALLLGGYRLANHASLCRNAEANLTGVWDPSRRAAVQTAFKVSGVPGYQAIWENVAQRLDSYAQSWVTQRTEACLATRVRGDQSDEVLSMRTYCLDRRLSEMKALTTLFLTADTSIVTNAVAAAHALPELGSCADVNGLRARVQLPANPAARARVDVLRQSYYQTKALYESGKVQEALARIRPLVEAAQQTRYLPLVAEGLYLEGRFEWLANPVHSEQLLREAFYDAEASRDDEAAIQAATLLTRLEADRSQHDLALNWARIAGALLDRTDGFHALRAEWQNTMAFTLWHQGHFAEALKAADQALALEKDGANEDELTLARSHAFRGIVLDGLGRGGEAREEYFRALSLRERAVGRQTPESAAVLNDIAVSYQKQDDVADGLRYQQEAVGILTRTLGPENPRTLNSVLGVAELKLMQGQMDKACATFRDILRAYEGSFGPNDPDVSQPLTDLGDCALKSGMPNSAIAFYDRALRLREDGLGSNHPDVATALTALAKANLALGRPKDALPQLERALGLQVPPDVAPSDLAQTRFALAQALTALHQNAPRARELANQARTGFAEAQLSRRVDQVDRWLEAHPQR